MLLFLLLNIFSFSQNNINRVEYFFDTDPGFGNAISIPITASPNLEDITHTVDISTLSNGFHSIYIRSRDDSGNWSISNRQTIFRASAGFTNNARIIKAEYFFDSDPGFGNAISIGIIANNNIADLTASIDLSNVSNGFHSFFIRTQDENGVWTLTSTQLIFKTGSNNTISNIIAAEYFFDADPGFGNGVNIPFTPAANISDLVLSIDISSISSGFHSFFIRSKDVNGNWSLTNTQALFKTGTNTSLPNLVKAEYFFDIDPGFGNGIAVPFGATTNLQDSIVAIDLTNVTNGFHTFNYRIQDQNGSWSLNNRASFFKLGSTTIANIIKVEYFIDTDPGFGSGINIPVIEGLNINDITNSISKSALTDGTHQLFVRAQDANGSWSITNSLSFEHITPKSGSGHCLSFTGTGKKVVNSINKVAFNNFTMEAWVKPTATTTIHNVSASGINGTTGTNRFVAFPTWSNSIMAGAAGIGFSVGTNGICVYEHDNSHLPITLNWTGTLNGWNHIAITYTNRVPRIYVNGRLVATGTTSIKSNVFASYGEIGGGAYGSFNGSIDEFKVWNTPLTQTELRERMCKKINESESLLNNLVVYYRFDEALSNTTTTYNQFADSINSTFTNAPTREISGAPIGDTSAYVYATSGLPNNKLSFNNQDSLSISYTSGSYTSEAGSHIYAVNSKPNSNIGLGGIALNNNRYFGVFSANLVNPQYTVNYFYQGNPFITGILPNELGLFKRDDNSFTTWVNSNANLNSSNNSIQATGEFTEYILSNCAVAVVPTITVNRTFPNVCDVTVANFSASITGGGSNPIYQWKLNGTDVGTNYNTYSNSALANNDSVWCVLTSNASCVNTPVVSSNKVKTIYPSITTQNINIFGCFTASYNSINYTSNTSFIDTIKTNQGCDSIYKNVTITVYTNAVTYDTVRVSGCNSVLYNSNTYTSSTAFTDTIKTVAGCDNIYRRIIITVHTIIPTIQNTSLIGCGSATHNNVSYTTNNLVKDTLKSVSGCDSIYVHTQITIINPVIQNVSYLGCGSYTYNNITYNSSTSLIDTIKSQTGCDSIYKNITITVVHSINLNSSLNGCNSVTYKSVTYTNSTLVRDTIKSSLGCDSIINIVTITITNVTPVNQTLYLVGCNSVVYNNVTYNNSTTLNQTIYSYQGCDSVYRTINITVHQSNPVTNSSTYSGCNSIVYNSNNYTSSTTLRDTVRNANGCDSIYNVVFINVIQVVATTQTINIAGCDSATYNNLVYYVSTILNDTLYSYLGCDSIYRTINITVQQKPTINVTSSISPVCSTNPTTLTASGGGNYTWSPSTALSSTSGAIVSASPANTITYTVTSNQTCVVSKTITITTKPLPNIDAGLNQTILLGSSTTLSATGGVRYVWNNGDTTASIVVSPTSNTNYIVTGTGANGCTAQDLVSVAVNFSSLAANTNNYNYGNVVVNYSASTNITITNNGTLAITLNGASVSSPYSASLSSTILQPNTSVNIPVTFSPTATLFYVSSMIINTSIGDLVVSLQGRGVTPNPSWVITPSNQTFSNTLIGDSATKTFTLVNTGNIPINISNITSSNSMFTGVSTSNTLAVGGNATIIVKYKPSTIATHNATIYINSSTPNLSSTTATVSGNGYVNNVPPVLQFVNTSPYNGNIGVDKSIGQPGLFTYNIVYKSITNTAPQAGYPKVGIDVNGDGDFIDNDEGIYEMSQVNATVNWVAGEEFTFSTNLAIGNTYSYQFFANDSLGNPATTLNTARYSGPTITDQTLDLSILANDISFSVAHPNVNQTFTVFATVHNNSPYSASNVNVRFYTDSIYYNETIIPFIAANSTQTISMNFTYNLDGFYPIKVWIDSAGNLGETNALNNTAIRPITVGLFTVPGAIIVNANARGQNCPDAMVVSGNAYYTGLNLTSNPPVLGAFVQVWENGNVIGSTYTSTEGAYTVYIPHSCGSGNYEVTITDYTLTGNSTTKTYSIACGVNCGGGYSNTGDYTPNFYGYSGGTPCCIVAYNSFSHTYNFKNNNTYKYTNDTFLVYVNDTLKYLYTRDSISPGQTISYISNFNLGVGNHTIKYKSIHHYAYSILSTDTSGGGISIIVTNYTGVIKDSMLTNINIDSPKSDLTLSSFSQNAAKSFTVKVGNSTCINASVSQLYIYETNANYDSNTAILIDSISTTSIAAGKCGDTRVALTYNRNSWTQGYHYLILKADGGNVIEELNESNNELRTTIYVPQPELTVSNLQASNSSASAGSNINFMATVNNIGGAIANNFKIQFYVNNVAFGAKQNISSLAQNSTTTISSAIYTIPSNNNCNIDIKVVVDVDNDIAELNENNNADSIMFGSDIVSGNHCNYIGSSCNPYIVYFGTPLTMSAPVTNNGLRDIDITGVRFSLNGNVLGTDNIAHIAAKSTAPVLLTHTFNTPGNYVIEVEPDFNNDYCETNENNNLGYIYVTVTTAVPDLQVLSHFINPSNLNPNPGQSINVSTTVKNIGTLASQPSYVRFWVDNVQLGSDVPLNSIKVGRDTAVAASLTYIGTTVGPKIIKVTVHYGEGITGFEQTYTNNEATRSIIVGAAPDFARTINEGIKANRNKYRIGKEINLSNYIRNYGGDNGVAWLKFYYRDTFGIKTLIDSVQFAINHHDSARISKRWTVAGYGRIITEIANSNPPEFNALNNIDSMDLVIDTTTPSIIVTPNLSNVCEGTSITFTASSTNVITPKYVWSINGLLTNDTAVSITRVMNVGDYVSCVLLDEEQYLITSLNIAPTLRLKSYSSTSITVCSNQLPYAWNSAIYTAAGTYTRYLTNALGCDSVVTLVLSVKQASSSTKIDSIYAGSSYSYNGNIYTAAGTYTSYLTNSIGCDSAIILVLTIRQASNGGPITGVFKSCSFNTPNRIYAPVPLGTWTSSDSNIAKVDKYSNVIGISNGSVVLTYTYVLNGITYISSINYIVAVMPNPTPIIGNNNTCIGSSTALSCATPNGIWSGNSNVNISNTGIVTGIHAGSLNINYTVSNIYGCSASSTLLFTVNSNPAVPSIAYGAGVNPQAGAPAGSFCKGRSFNLIGFPSGGVWSSQNSSVATISNTGNVNLITTGTASIKYSFTNSNGCTNSRTMSGTVVNCASRVNNEIATQKEFVIYPNPAKNKVNISLNKNLISGEIIITNLLGKIVAKKLIIVNNNSLDISNLAKGIYLITIISNDYKESKKLIIE